jgi:hypothetical protein
MEVAEENKTHLCAQNGCHVDMKVTKNTRNTFSAFVALC